MNENENGRKRREWVKTAAIVFLSILLVLTFFSNTIMNYSLPEVATQYVQTGTITAKVRGTGKVEASDPYNVIAKESRVITSVAVKQGDIVEKDQILAWIGDTPVRASLTGVLRGIIRDGFTVPKGMKIADIDPRKEQKKNCFTISDKARCIAGSVVEILLSEGVMPYEAPDRFSGITAD